MRRFITLLAFFVLCWLPIAPVYPQSNSADDGIIRLGRGSADAVAWSPRGDLIAVAGSAGIWLYTPTLELVAHYEMRLTPSILWWTPDARWLSVRVRQVDGTVLHVFDIETWNTPSTLSTFGEIYEIYATKDNRFTVIRSSAGLYLLDAITHEERFHLRNGLYAILSPDNSRLAVATAQSIWLYDTVMFNKHVQMMDEEAGLSNHIEWSPDGTKIAAISQNRILVWDSVTGVRTHTFMSKFLNSDSDLGPPIMRVLIRQIEWMGDSLNISAMHGNWQSWQIGYLMQWSLVTNSVSEIDNGWVNVDLEWTPTFSGIVLGNRSAHGSYSSNIILTHDDGSVRSELMDTGKYEFARWRLSPNRRFYITYSNRMSTIDMFNAENLEPLSMFEIQASPAIDVAWSPDSTRFASVHRDEVQVWSIQDRSRVARSVFHFKSFPDLIAWSPNGEYVSFASTGIISPYSHNHGSVRVFNVDGEQSVITLPGHREVVTRFQWNSDSTHIFTMGPYDAYLWDTATGARQTRIHLPYDETSFWTSFGYADWSSDNETIAVSNTQAHLVLLFKGSTGNFLREISVPSPQYLAFRPSDSDQLAIGTVSSWGIWELSTSIQLSQMALNTEFSTDLKWHSSGQWLLTSHAALEVWQVPPDGRNPTRITTLDITPAPMTWHPTLPILAVAQQMSIHLLDVTTGETVVIIEGYDNGREEASIINLDWSPDGTRFAYFINDDPYLYIHPVEVPPQN